MGAPLPNVDDAVKTAAELLAQHDRVAVVGPDGAGKSTVLERLRAQWPLKGPTPITVRIPQTTDGALTALAHAGVALLPFAPDLEGKLRSLELRFDDKARAVCDVIDAHDVPVLVEDVTLQRPIIWQDAFDLHRQALFDRLLGLDAPVVYTTKSRPPPEIARVQVSKLSDAAAVLSPKQWNGLGAIAQQLLKEGGGKLADYSPLELRLAVLVSKETSVGKVLTEGWRLTELLDRGFAYLGGERSAQLKEIAARLALVRDPLDDGWLSWALGKGLDASVRGALFQVLLFEEHGRWRLHESIATQALKRQGGWLTHDRINAAHRELAAQYEQRFKLATEQKDVGAALRFEVEIIHHLTEAADPKLLDKSLLFIEQYDNLGRTLSQDGIAKLKHGRSQEGRQLLKLSTAAYERALEHDNDDAYALHYTAFNADVLAEERSRVRELYERAIAVRPDWVWSHSRYLRFLIATGQFQDFRAAWEAARDELMPTGAADDLRLYDELHCDVARMLMHFGQLAAARGVLKDVPTQLTTELRRFKRLLELVRMHGEVEREELVFPPWIPDDERWSHAHLVPAAERATVKWYPGCVAHVEPGLVRFRIATRSGDAVTYAWDEPGAELLDPVRHRLRVGTFVEFVTRADGPREVLVHPPIGDYFELVAVKFPDPNRYLDAA